jgi:hypothetical protein
MLFLIATETIIKTLPVSGTGAILQEKGSTI